MRRLAVLLLLVCSVASASDFNLTDLSGKNHKLADYKGKWVLINLWATWCPPCLEEIPDLIALQETHKNLAVIGVVVDYESRKKVTDFVDDNLMSYPIVLGDEKVIQQFGRAEVLPSTYLYNPQGKLVKLHRGLITRQTVEKLMQ
ncbi:MAG: TlpA family protein disulfide reductase [Methylophilales bacterium]|nr:TlpA family protein disulfide reductase [Methylophilales bacterium]